MAIFHLDLRQIKRQTAKGKIKKVDAIIAYRERIKINDFDYSKKQDFITSFCLFPPEFQDSEYAKNLKNAAFFASEIEKIEKRKDSQLFDELILALPHELNLEENKKIITELLSVHYITQNQMARVCIHRSKNNLHCHILIPQRPLENSENGVKFGKKIRPEFTKFGNPKSSDKLIKMRSDWANIANAKLAEIGSNAKISHLSLKNRRAEALSRGDVELAAKLDRPAIYLPNSAYSPKFKLITAENDRFKPDLNKMNEARKFYAKRHNLESYTWDDLSAEKLFWEDLEEKGRIKIGIGMNTIRQMIRRFIRIMTTNNFTDLIKNESESESNRYNGLGRSKRNPTTILIGNQPNCNDSSISLCRNTRTINNHGTEENEQNRENNKIAIQGSNGIDKQTGSNEQVNKRLTIYDPMACWQPPVGINIYRNNRYYQDRRFVPDKPVKTPTPPRRKPKRR